MSLTLEHQTLLTTNKKLVDVIVEEGHTSYSNGAGLATLKVKALLNKVKEMNHDHRLTAFVHNCYKQNFKYLNSE